MSDVPIASTSLTSQPSPNTFGLHNRDATMNIESTKTDVMEISYESDSFDEESDNSNKINYVYVKREYKMESSTYISTTVSTRNKSSSDLEYSILNDTNKEELSSENAALIDHITDVQTPPVTPIPTSKQEPMETDDLTLLIRNMSDVPTASTSTAPYLTITSADLISELSDDGSDEEWANLKYKLKNNNNLTSSPSLQSTTASIEKKSSFDPEEPILKESIENLAMFDESIDNHTIPGTHSVKLLLIDEVELDTMNVEEHVRRLKALEKELEFIEATEWMFQPIDSSIRL